MNGDLTGFDDRLFWSI